MSNIKRKQTLQKTEAKSADLWNEYSRKEAPQPNFWSQYEELIAQAKTIKQTLPETLPVSQSITKQNEPEYIFKERLTEHNKITIFGLSLIPASLLGFSFIDGWDSWMFGSYIISLFILQTSILLYICSLHIYRITPTYLTRQRIYLRSRSSRYELTDIMYLYTQELSLTQYNIITKMLYIRLTEGKDIQKEIRLKPKDEKLFLKKLKEKGVQVG